MEVTQKSGEQSKLKLNYDMAQLQTTDIVDLCKLKR
jgi:hypothetical protein